MLAAAPLEAFQPVAQEVVIAPVPHTLGAEDMQLLLLHIEDHLETVFTSKLDDELNNFKNWRLIWRSANSRRNFQLLQDALNTSRHNG